MNTIKNGVPRPVRPAVRKPDGTKVLTHLIAVILQIPPTAYIALTGTVPLWARVWLIVYLVLWLTVTVVSAVETQVKESGR